MPRKKTAPEAEAAVTVALPNGSGTIQMRPLTTARQVIAMSSGEAIASMQTVLDAIIEPADREKVLDLPYQELMDLGIAWLEARKEEAVPPPSA